ncbi:MAG: glycosyltransferase [Acidimicrobiales bacterium]|nr:glycosyltransferase [Acidimicrobiales bacterium]
MARYLFVVPPLTGHINPTLAVGDELLKRGHVVAWCGYGPMLYDRVPRGGEVISVADDIPDSLRKAVEERSKGLRGAAALKFFWEEFLTPLAHAMVPAVELGVEDFKPDGIIVDQQTVAGALVALRHSIPFATSATTSAELADPFSVFPKLREWADNCLISFQLEHGVPRLVANAKRLRESSNLVLAFTTPALMGENPNYPTHWEFVGPALGGRRETKTEFDLSELSLGKKKILVSLGTLNGGVGERFYNVVIDALREMDVQALIVAPEGMIEDPPENVIVRSWIPQLEILSHFDAVVTHGGHNTVCESLAQGLPLVMAPIRDDQPVVADQVVASGAGIRVRFVRVQPPEMRDAINAVLNEPKYKEAALFVKKSFEQGGGATRAADCLEVMVGK